MRCALAVALLLLAGCEGLALGSMSLDSKPPEPSTGGGAGGSGGGAAPSTGSGGGGGGDVLPGTGGGTIDGGTPTVDLTPKGPRGPVVPGAVMAAMRGG